MTHLDDGQLRALLDDELNDAEAGSARVHLGGCDECAQLLARIEAQGVTAREAIAILDVPAPAAGARQAVLARVRGTSSSSERPVPSEPSEAVSWAPFYLTLKRAAVIVLLLTGLAAALPGSAVRAWMVSRWTVAVEMFTGTESGAQPAAAELATSGQESDVAGVEFEVTDEPLRIVLAQIESGSLVVVRFVEGTRAALSGSDARFRRTADGRFEVTGGSGTIRIDVPRTVADASLWVNERIYLTVDGNRIDATGPIEAQTPEEISFRVR
ncbi:MAG: hypothetical protein IH968_01350 [Gemmatimonadetes bacterium]|nr:hypothetical protein [Gemmatimonadota bacterium]